MAIALGKFWIDSDGTPNQSWISAFNYGEPTSSVEEALFFSSRQDAEIFCLQNYWEDYSIILFEEYAD